MFRAYLLTLCLFVFGYQMKARAEVPPPHVPLVFYCEVDAVHSVSIIADAEGLIYAYAKEDSPELVIYGDKSNLRYAYSTLGGGGGMYYRFIKNGYSYQVYSATLSDGTYREGVKVFNGEKEISDKTCLGDAISNVPGFDPAAELVEDSRNNQLTYGF